MEISRFIQSELTEHLGKEEITLLQLLSNRIGRHVNYQDLANMTNLSVPTVKTALSSKKFCRFLPIRKRS